MTWEQLPDDVKTVAERALTVKQLEVFKLHVAGLSDHQMMWKLGIHRSTARDRLNAATLNLLRAGVRQDPSGRWHYSEEAA